MEFPLSSPFFFDFDLSISYWIHWISLTDRKRKSLCKKKKKMGNFNGNARRYLQILCVQSVFSFRKYLFMLMCTEGRCQFIHFARQRKNDTISSIVWIDSNFLRLLDSTPRHTTSLKRFFPFIFTPTPRSNSTLPRSRIARCCMRMKRKTFFFHSILLSKKLVIFMYAQNSSSSFLGAQKSNQIFTFATSRWWWWGVEWTSEQHRKGEKSHNNSQFHPQFSLIHCLRMLIIFFLRFLPSRLRVTICNKILQHFESTRHCKLCRM